MSRLRLRLHNLLTVCLLWSGCLAAFCSPVAVLAQDGIYQVGMARADITPDFPVRLNGFGSRRTESEGVRQQIFAKALAIGSGADLSVLITVDNLGIREMHINEVAKRLGQDFGLQRARLTVACSHSHTTPMLTDTNVTLFGVAIPPEHLMSIDRYTQMLLQKLYAVAAEAIQAQQPARLAWGQGKVAFAANRRTPGGPVDHDLPVLFVLSAEDPSTVRAVFTSYACHCVTLSDNKISGDWAGYAQEFIEKKFPGSLGLVAIGCGADANPSSGVTGDRGDIAAQQGAELADEVARVQAAGLQPLLGALQIRRTDFELPLSAHPTREEWEARAKQDNAVGYHARYQMAKLDRGEKLRTAVPYSVQSWSFGDELAMVFLPGEVVVDFSLRLKKELHASRLWVCAYSNDAPCYIPSERVLTEGGYEGEFAMTYYDQPCKFAPGLEQLIMDAALAQLQPAFDKPAAAGAASANQPAAADLSATEGTQAVPADKALETFQLPPGLVIEQVACEPLVVDPVAIDFAPDGRLFVAEMHDYPTGLRGEYDPGGRVRVLKDSNGDGRYDQSTIFVDGIPFPTGVTVWKRGVLICAAPDILYAEDSDNDGAADHVQTLFSGFATHNYQARVNSLSWCADGWLYGACGLFGATVQSHTGQTAQIQSDFRIRPEEGLIEPVSGTTQQGRAKDDWDRWFGCHNGCLVQHFPLEERYLRRNPFVVYPNGILPLPPDNQLYPVSKPLERFNDLDHLNRVTSGCGLTIYRDTHLGADYLGNAFACDPVHNVVVRFQLSEQGTSFQAIAERTPQGNDFLASQDNWFRPVQCRSGPDGALWVVDMYRFLVEHPIWVRPDRLAQLDVRAGSDRGRIYRIYPKDAPPKKLVSIHQMSQRQMAVELTTTSGTRRDQLQQALLPSSDNASAAPGNERLGPADGSLLSLSPEASSALHDIALAEPSVEYAAHAPAASRAAAAQLLFAHRQIKSVAVLQLLKAADPHLRVAALRMTEGIISGADFTVEESPRTDKRGRMLGTLADMPAIYEAIVDLQHDDSLLVRRQLAYSLGESDSPGVAPVLAKLAVESNGDEFLLAAVASSLSAGNLPAFISSIARSSAPHEQKLNLLERWLPLAVLLNTPQAGAESLEFLLGADRPALDTLESLTPMYAGLRSQSKTAADWLDGHTAILVRTDALWKTVRELASSAEAPLEDRARALTLLGWDVRHAETDVQLLQQFVSPQMAKELQAAALQGMSQMTTAQTAAFLIDAWSTLDADLQAQAADVLLSREHWAEQLVAALEADRVSWRVLSAEARQRLLEWPEEALRARIAALPQATISADRQAVIGRVKEELNALGDAPLGQQVFTKRCSMCHRWKEQGFAVGPDLWALTDRSVDAYLIAILDPNRAIEAKFVQYTAETNQGTIHQGILVPESGGSLRLVASGGKEAVILREDLVELHAAGTSLMPNGLENDLSIEEFRHLLAFLTAPSN